MAFGLADDGPTPTDGMRNPMAGFRRSGWFRTCALIVALAAGCGKEPKKEAGQTPASPTGATLAVHNRMDIPVATRPAAPPGLSVGADVWALLPYPSYPGRYRLTPGRVLGMNRSEAVVENGGVRTAGIPYSLIYPRQKSLVKKGNFVVAAGKAGVYAAKVGELSGDSLKVSRIWRDSVREETVPVTDVIVQQGTREPGQIVFYHDQGFWNQGLLLLLEERHAWVLESFGGAVLRVGETETHPWNPGFSPVLGQEVEACRGASSHLVRGIVAASGPGGLFFDVRLSNGSIRQRVPVWEMLPTGTLLQ